MDPVPPGPDLTAFVLAALPALAAVAFSVGGAAVHALSASRLSALQEHLTGAQRQAIERYVKHTGRVESRWLTLRILGVTATAILIFSLLHPSRGEAWNTVIAAFCALGIYGLPATLLGSLAARRAERAAPRLLRVLRPFEFIAAPFALPLELLTRTGSPATNRPSSDDLLKTEVEAVVREGELSGTIAHDQSELIRNVLDVEDRTAGDVMVPRPQVVAFDVATRPSTLLRSVSKHPHSRFPVYGERKDNVLGVLHVKDLIAHAVRGDEKDEDLSEIIRTPAIFLPENTPALDVLNDMRAGRQHLAIVIDEFGGMCGIVTLEDLLEEIVGEIQDEHDHEHEPIVRLGNGRVLVAASLSLSDLERHLHIALEEGDYHSLGGFVVHETGRVPPVGTTLHAANVELIIHAADERHIETIEIVLPKADEDPDDGNSDLASRTEGRRSSHAA